MPIILQDGNIVCGKEVNFLNFDEAEYPQLMRLQLDFDFRVLSLSNSNSSTANVATDKQTKNSSPPAQARYLVTFNAHQHENVPTITPVFSSLPELEQYASDNIVDILNNLIIDTLDD